jgi:integrase
MLTDAVTTYLAIRRAAGVVLKCEGYQLKSFAAFAEVRGDQCISSDLAIEWAGLRRPPYILTMDHIRQLIETVSHLGYRTLRRATYSTLFALLACTGLRVSEAIRLRFDDITPDGLVIQGTKFRKSRLVP